MSSIALNTSALDEALTARTTDGRQISEVFLVACGGMDRWLRQLAQRVSVGATRLG